MVKDLTVGKPEEVLWKFSIPMFVSVIFQQIYNAYFFCCVVDSVDGPGTDRNQGTDAHDPDTG